MSSVPQVQSEGGETIAFFYSRQSWGTEPYSGAPSAQPVVLCYTVAIAFVNLSAQPVVPLSQPYLTKSRTESEYTTPSLVLVVLYYCD